MTRPTRPIVLCADDYAMSEGVSRGIVELARAGQISATSVMSVSPLWPRLADPLRALDEGIAVGLHLTLTWGRPLGPMPRLAPGGAFPPLRRLIALTLSGRVDRPEVAAEIAHQLDRFEAVWGRPPDFIDGHQHVHALPGLRGPVIEVAATRGLAGRTWIRNPADSPARIARRGGPVMKATVVSALSAGFEAAASRAGFATNRGFAGFSSFEPDTDVAADFGRFVSAPGPAHLVMCHPGHVAPSETLDGVTETRSRELAYLASGRFTALFQERGLRLVKGPEFT